MASDSLFYVKRQLVAIAIGAVCAVALMRSDYSRLSRYSRYVYVATLVLLLAVLLFGREVRGTQGWIGLGSRGVQPAELAKVMVVVAFAEFLSSRQGQLNTLRELLPCFLYVGVPFALIMLQPDLGTAMVMVAVMFGMMFVAGASPRVLLGVMAAGAGIIALALFLHYSFGTWLPLQDYQLMRLSVFLDPYNDGQGGRGAGWNTIQSLVAIGSGGFWGKGVFHGTQVQLNFLPELHTDFIYAVVGEELGFLGAAGLLVLYWILLSRALQVAFLSKDLYGTLCVVGVATIWLFHVVENVGMSLGVMPVTGIPLPFVSYGGSAMLANLLGAGLVLSVNIKGNRSLF
jgi:rod shape determining protein RodA